MLLIEVAQGLVASPRENRRVASLGDPALQQSRELRLVFDNQNAFVHAVSPLSNGNVKLTRVPEGAGPQAGLSPDARPDWLRQGHLADARPTLRMTQAGARE